jgi:hypothetical protein
MKRATLMIELEVTYPDDIRLAEVVDAVATFLAEREVMLPLPVGWLLDGRKIELQQVRLQGERNGEPLP